MKTKMKFRPSGFTIVELVVVVAVIGILAGMTIVGYGAWHQHITEDSMRSDLRQAKTHLLDRQEWENGFPDALTSFTASNENELFYSRTSGGFCASISNSTTNKTFMITNKTDIEDGACPGSQPPSIEGVSVSGRDVFCLDGPTSPYVRVSAYVTNDSGQPIIAGENNVTIAPGTGGMVNVTAEPGNYNKETVYIPISSPTESFAPFSIATQGNGSKECPTHYLYPSIDPDEIAITVISLMCYGPTESIFSLNITNNLDVPMDLDGSVPYLSSIEPGTTMNKYAYNSPNLAANQATVTIISREHAFPPVGKSLPPHNAISCS